MYEVPIQAAEFASDTICQLVRLIYYKLTEILLHYILTSLFVILAIWIGVYFILRVIGSLVDFLGSKETGNAIRNVSQGLGIAKLISYLF